MPTRDVLGSFWNDYDQLTQAQQAQFRAAVRQFVDDLKQLSALSRESSRQTRAKSAGRLRNDRAPDGRAAFEFGPLQIPGEVHIIWRRIGGRDIFKQP